MTLPASPVWFITGCSTGFGRDLARLVLDRGWRAVVTARDADRVADLVEGHDDTALALALVWLAYSAVYTGMRAFTNGYAARTL